MTTTAHNVTLPLYNLSRITKLRDRLADDILTDYCGFVPEGEHYENFVDRVNAGIGGVNRLALWESLRYLAGTLLRDHDIRMMGWRIAGNMDRLKAGQAVPPWLGQRAPEWMPAQVVSYEYEKTRRGKPGGIFGLRIMAGTACPMRITTFWPNSACGLLARVVGYTARNKDFPIQHPSELVSMRLWLLIEPERSQATMPGFYEVNCSPGLKKWNRDIIKKRFRAGWVCPYNYDHYCYKCPVGYLECPAATHRETRSDGTQSTQPSAGSGSGEGASSDDVNAT